MTIAAVVMSGAAVETDAWVSERCRRPLARWRSNVGTDVHRGAELFAHHALAASSQVLSKALYTSDVLLCVYPSKSTRSPARGRHQLIVPLTGPGLSLT